MATANTPRRYADSCPKRVLDQIIAIRADRDADLAPRLAALADSVAAVTAAVTRAAALTDYIEQRVGGNDQRGERVHRRPLVGMGDINPGTLPVGETTVARVADPFGAAVGTIPVPAGNHRVWRLYMVYTDSIVAGDGPIVRFKFAGTATGTLVFRFPFTAGVAGAALGPTRDAYSDGGNVLAAADVAPYLGAGAIATVTVALTAPGTVYRLELHAMDVVGTKASQIIAE